MPHLSSGQAKGLSPGFYDYLNGLREEFELLSTSTKSSRRSRFNIHLRSLKDEFEFMAGEIDSLHQKRDEYRGKVEVLAKELRKVRDKVVCERCSQRTTSARRIIAPSQLKTMKTASSSSAGHDFQSRSPERSGKYGSWPGIQKTTSPNRSHQRMILIRKLQSATITPTITPTQRSRSVSNDTSRPSDTIVAHSQTITLQSPLSQLPASEATADSDSGAEKRDWSSTFHDKVEMELDVEIAHALIFHGDTIECVKFSRDGKYLAAGCHDGKAYIYDVETGTLICVLRNLLAEHDSLIGVCFSRSGEYLATSSSEGHIYVWEIRTKYVRNAFKGHTRLINTLDFSPNDRLLVSASNDNSVCLWSMRHGAVKVLEDHMFFDVGFYTSAVFSADGMYVAASNYDGMVRIWNARTGQLMRRVKAHMDWTYDVMFMPDGEGLVTGGFDKTLRFWDISSLDPTRLRARSELDTGVEEQTQPVQEFSGHKDSVNAVAISPDGRWVASASDDKSVRVWNNRNATTQCILNHGHWVLAVDFSPSGCYLASGGLDRTVRIWRYSCVTSESN